MATTADVAALIAANLPDNVSGLITPTKQREVETALLNYALRDQILIEDTGLTITSAEVTINSILCINKPQVQKIIMNNLVTITGQIQVTGNLFIDELDLDVLEEVTGQIIVFGNPVLATVDLSSLQECSSIILGGSTITTIDLSALVTVSSINVSDNASLATASVSDATTCIDISFADCALNTASVNGILADINTAGQINGTLNLGGGTNASPTGGVLNADYVALVGNGWTVTIN